MFGDMRTVRLLMLLPKRSLYFHPEWYLTILLHIWGSKTPVWPFLTSYVLFQGKEIPEVCVNSTGHLLNAIRNWEVGPSWICYLRKGAFLHKIRYNDSRIYYFPVNLSLTFLLDHTVGVLCCTVVLFALQYNSGMQ